MSYEIFNEDVVEFEFLDFSVIYNSKEDTWYVWCYDENLAEQKIPVASKEEIESITGEKVNFEFLQKRVKKLFLKEENKNESSQRIKNNNTRLLG